MSDEYLDFKRKTWGFFKILKQILKNVVINIPNDM
jgi:hypothetical protein